MPTVTRERQSAEKKKRSRAEMTEALAEYKVKAAKVSDTLRKLENKSEDSLWEHATIAASESESLESEYGDLKSKEAIYADIAVGTKWGPASIKKHVLCIGALSRAKLEEIAIRPESGFNQICDVMVSSGLGWDDKTELALLVYKHDKSHPDAPYTMQQVREMIADRKPSKGDKEDWERSTDYWGFKDFDPRFGHDGYIGRLPGQAALNAMKRWLPPGGSVLSAMCGSGTVLDAAKYLKITKEYRGFDLTPSERSIKIHNKEVERVVQFDATKDDWRKAVPRDWKADFLIVTPPDFNFFVQAMSVEPTDLGNIIDIEQWLAAWEAIISGAVSVMSSGGVICVVTKSTSQFDNETPVHDLEYELVKMLHERGVEQFLARAVVRIAKAAPKAESNDGKPYLIPEVRHLNVFRYTQ